MFLFNFIRKLFQFPPIEKVICILSQGKKLESFVGKLVPGNNLYLPKTVRKVKRNGINYILDISDYQNWLVYFGIAADRPDGLHELVKKGATIIDIGSNIGQTAMNLAKLAGEGSTILGFEPDPVNYSRAIENLNLNTFKNIHYFNIGLGSQKGELPLKVNSPLNRGGNRIDRNNHLSSFIVKIEQLDTIIYEQKITRIDLIKIDVEGFELEVLKGAKQILHQFKPVLYVEVSDSNLREQGASATELINYILEFGYTNIINAKTNRALTDLHSLKNYQFDIICS